MTGSHLNFGARMYDSRIGRWMSVDAFTDAYPYASPYNFALNTPICAVDPDGNLVLFIGGLRLWQANEQDIWKKGGTFHRSDVFDYWSASFNDVGEFNIDIAKSFCDRIGDVNTYFTSGSSDWTSTAKQRYLEGRIKAQRFHAMVQSGEITLANDESIKIVSHSQGGAHAAGLAKQLMSYKDDNGNPIYNIEVMYYITPHQPTDFVHPEGILGKQYSHPNDAVSSRNWTPNGGTKYGKIPRISEFVSNTIVGDDAVDKSFYEKLKILNTHRNGHNVESNTFIFDIEEGQEGYVEPRKDKL